MGISEAFYFATDALLKIATEDPHCIPLRLFFDREVKVFTTRRCYEDAFQAFSRDRIDREKARISFDLYFEKAKVVDVDAQRVENLAQKYECEDAAASLLAAINMSQASPEKRKLDCFLVTSDKALLAAARIEGIKFHDYTEQEFCEKYGS